MRAQLRTCIYVHTFPATICLFLGWCGETCAGSRTGWSREEQSAADDDDDVMKRVQLRTCMYTCKFLISHNPQKSFCF